jgi:hypothetical protein
METPNTFEKVSSAVDSLDFNQPHNMAPTIGIYPKRQNTVTAAVLGQLLEGRELTSMSAVRGANTTRLAPVVHRLKNEYGWTIDAPEIKVDTADGRVAIVSRYFIPEAVRDAAMSTGAYAYCEAVALAREQRRQTGRAA